MQRYQGDDKGVLLRAGIKPEAKVKKLPKRISGSANVDRWAEENDVDVVDLDGNLVVRNPDVLMVDDYDYSLPQSAVMTYRAKGYRIPEKYSDVELPYESRPETFELARTSLSKGWDPREHPRWPSGFGDKSGEFRRKGRLPGLSGREALGSAQGSLPGMGRDMDQEDDQRIRRGARYRKAIREINESGLMRKMRREGLEAQDYRDLAPYIVDLRRYAVPENERAVDHFAEYMAKARHWAENIEHGGGDVILNQMRRQDAEETALVVYRERLVTPDTAREQQLRTTRSSSSVNSERSSPLPGEEGFDWEEHAQPEARTPFTPRSDRSQTNVDPINRLAARLGRQAAEDQQDYVDPETLGSVSSPTITGVIGDTRIVEFESGEQAVLKTGAVMDTHNEYLAFRVAQVIGANTPTVHMLNQRQVLMSYVDGVTAHEALDRHERNLWPLRNTAEYGRMELLDYLIGNSDRHLGNWMITQDGHIVGIDHGFAFGSPGLGPDRRRLAKQFTVDDLDEIRDDLDDLEPIFTSLDRQIAYDDMMESYTKLYAEIES